jgi:hypothetical protein
LRLFRRARAFLPPAYADALSATESGATAPWRYRAASGTRCRAGSLPYRVRGLPTGRVWRVRTVAQAAPLQVNIGAQQVNVVGGVAPAGTTIEGEAVPNPKA